MRDPWFPVALLLIVLLGVWLGILGPAPNGAVSWLQAWQPLIAATVASTVASIAAYIAFQNTSRSLAHAEQLEMNRRRQKHAAVRAVLPLGLAQITSYAQQSAGELKSLLSSLSANPAYRLAKISGSNLLTPLPTEALRTLAEFIEYADDEPPKVLHSTVAWIQMHNSRIRRLLDAQNNIKLFVRKDVVEAYIISAASIHAGASGFFLYARGTRDKIPTATAWQDVEKSLKNMEFNLKEYPQLYELITQRKARSAGPFETLSENG